MNLVDLKQKIENLQKKKSFLEGQLQPLEKQREEILKEIVSYNTTIDQLPLSIENLKKEIDEESTKLEQLLGDVDGKVNSL